MLRQRTLRTSIYSGVHGQTGTPPQGTLPLIGSRYESGTFYARFLVFYHEFFHLYYKLNPLIKVEDIKRLNRLADFNCGEAWFDDLGDDDADLLLKEGLETMFTSGSDKLLEEVSCDYRALLETISIIN